MLDWSALPIIDNHCHSWLRQPLALGPTEFRRCFGEARDPVLLRRHTPHLLTYRLALREIAGFLGVAPDEASVLAARSQAEWPAYLARLLQDGQIRGLLVDFGFQTADTFDPAQLSDLLGPTGCALWKILRLETLAEALIPASRDLGDLVERYRQALQDAHARGYVALKTIIAYRSGLDVAPADAAAAAEGLGAVKTSPTPSRIRLANKPLLDYLFWVALDVAAALEWPVQVHTGFGDNDLDLRLANPLHLRPVLEDPRFRSVPLVLLHTHPYVAEAAYLASVYSQAYVDLSLTVPFLGPAAADAFRSAVALASASKVLYGSDGFSIPELPWLGARWGRRALAEALDGWRAWGLPPGDLEATAARILADNAAALYRLGPISAPRYNG